MTSTLSAGSNRSAVLELSEEFGRHKAEIADQRLCGAC
jgi:hypothetical protein